MPSKKRSPKPPAVPPAAEGEAVPRKKTTKAAPEPIRAGGHIDRGDGRGWVLEED